MKIRIEIEEGIAEEEVVIRCRGLTKEVTAIQRAVSNLTNLTERFPFYQGNTEYYLPLEEILFFETDEKGMRTYRERIVSDKI